MDDCLFKPISLTLLSQRITTLEPLYPCSQVFNVECLYSLSGHNTAQTQRLLEELIRSNRQDLEALLEIPDNGELQTFGDIAHRIKGAARIVGANTLITQCEALEQANRANLTQARNRVQGAMQELEQALTRQLEKLANNT